MKIQVIPNQISFSIYTSDCSTGVDVYFWVEGERGFLPYVPEDAESPYIAPPYEGGGSREEWEEVERLIRETPCYKVLADFYREGGGRRVYESE